MKPPLLPVARRCMKSIHTVSQAAQHAIDGRQEETLDALNVAIEGIADAISLLGVTEISIKRADVPGEEPCFRTTLGRDDA